MVHYYVVVRFLLSLYTFVFTVHSSSSSIIMATNTNNLSANVTMESLIAEVRNLKSELTALQASNSMHNLSLDERGRERHPPHHGQSS